MKRTITVFALALAFSAIMFAHGNEKQMMGAVASIPDNSITVETTSKKTVTVSLSASTKFQKSGSPATLKDLKAGDKVVIHVTGSEDKLVATEIRFGPVNEDSISGKKGTDNTHTFTRFLRSLFVMTSGVPGKDLGRCLDVSIFVGPEGHEKVS